MATSEQDVSVQRKAETASDAAVKVRPKKGDSILDKLLSLLSSTRFGVVMLSILLICCMIGMLIMQKDVDGFEKYYREITPAQRLIFGYLGFFDIYHSWYFNLLMAVTGLNIILASIDRFPTAWQYIKNPKLIASPNFIRAQNFSKETALAGKPKEVAEKIKAAWRQHGFKAKITEDNDRLTVFAQRNVTNRLGAYIVHVALLTIFFGGFLTARYGMGGMMQITPGETTNAFTTFEMTLDGPRTGQATVPFQVECTDLQQKLIRPEGGLEAQNTIDWLSYIKVKDGGRETPALVHMNNPFDIKGAEPPRISTVAGTSVPSAIDNVIHTTLGGYRFFQSQFTPIGNARAIRVAFQPVAGGEPITATIQRNGSAEVPGIGKVDYTDFFCDFRMQEGQPGTISADYNNPVAQLTITKTDGTRQVVFAVNPREADNFYKAPEAAKDNQGENLLLVNGHKTILTEFEKVALGHTLAVQYDPGRTPVYVGFTLLCAALCFVFFLSHQRVWAVIEPDNHQAKVYMGGNTNRNRTSFETRFNTLVESVTGEGNQDE